MTSCKLCGEDFDGRPDQQFCSRSCSASYSNTHRAVRRTIPCGQCGKTIEQASPTQKVCSKKCAGAARAVHAKRAPITCKHCTADIEDPSSDQQFCTRSCSASYNNAQRVGNGRGPQSHCNDGHEFTEENTYKAKSGKRHCRECRRTRDGSKPRKATYVPVAQRRAEKVRKAEAKRLAPPAPAQLWRPAGFSPEVRVFGSRSA